MMADVQLAISKLLINPAVIFKITALTTKVNNPKVKILIGSDKSKSNGRKNILKKPMMITAINAELKEFILNPGTK